MAKIIFAVYLTAWAHGKDSAVSPCRRVTLRGHGAHFFAVSISLPCFFNDFVVILFFGVCSRQSIAVFVSLPCSFSAVCHAPVLCHVLLGLHTAKILFAVFRAFWHTAKERGDVSGIFPVARIQTN